MTANASMSVPASRTHLLQSWKEIANYLRRGVRTVQRWQALGLPVRRLGRGPKPPVVADPRDLDRWLQGAQVRGFKTSQPAESLANGNVVSDSLQQARRLREQMSVLREFHIASRDRFMATLTSLEKNCGSDPPILVSSRSVSHDDHHRYSGAHR